MNMLPFVRCKALHRFGAVLVMNCTLAYMALIGTISQSVKMEPSSRYMGTYTFFKQLINS